MPVEYLHGIIPQLPFPSTSITLIEGAGQFSQGGTLHLFFQGRNRAGYTQPSVKRSISYTAHQAIQISFPTAARTDATDFHFYVVSHSPTGNAIDAVTLFHWQNYEADQVTTLQLPNVTLSRDAHIKVSADDVVATPADLPTGADLLNGAVRLVIGGVPTSAYYKYEKYYEQASDGAMILMPHPGEKWVRTGSPNVGLVSDVFDTDGCAVPIFSVASSSLILPPPYAAQGQTPIPGTRLKIIYRNDQDVPMPQGTPFTLNVTLDNSIASQLFDGKLMLTPKGFVNLADGSLDTSNGIGGTMPDIDGNIPYCYGDRSTLVLHKDLPSNFGYYLEVAPLFTIEQMEGRLLEGSQIGIAISPATLSGDIATAIWKITGDIVLSDEEQLQVVPDVGLQATLLSGSAIIKKFVFPSRGSRSIYGIQANQKNQKITLDGNGSLFYRGTGVIPGTEAQRALISCETGYSINSDWTDFFQIDEPCSILAKLFYPCNASGNGIIRSDYPYIAGNTSGKFNPPYLQIFVKRQADNKIFRLPTYLPVLADTFQVVTIKSLSDCIEIANLPLPPTHDFCLFDPPRVTLEKDATGNIPSGFYSISCAYYFDGSAISAINHAPADGCIPTIPGTIEDLFAIGYSWGSSVKHNSIRDIPKNETFPWQTRRLWGEKQQIYFDPSSKALDDGNLTWKPNWQAIESPGRWILDERTAWYTVSGTPQPLLGINGDLALDTTNNPGSVYKKTQNHWALVGNIRGSSGRDATITIGQVRSLPPSSSPSITNSGTASNARLDFSIPSGSAGPQGPPGRVATLSIGQIRTLPPGQDAIVMNSGTPESAILDFGIPKGEAAATIQIGSVSTIDSGIPAQVTNSGSNSAVVLDFKIPKGADGVSFRVGSVSTLPAGNPANVKNSGTVSDVILDFEIPQGNPGDAGSQASNNTFGVIQLAGDLNGTAQAPTVPLIHTHIANTSNPHNVTSTQVGSQNPVWNASQLQSKAISTDNPLDGQALVWDNTEANWKPKTIVAGTGATTSQDATTINKGLIQLSGDLGGTAQTPTVITNTSAKWNASLLQSRPVANTMPLDGSVLTWDMVNNTWRPLPITGAPGATPTTMGVIKLAGELGGTAASPEITSNTVAKWNSNQLQGRAISPAAPVNNQILAWNDTASSWEPREITIPRVNDATATIKGIVSLAGDLGGTATSPLIATSDVAKWNAVKLRDRTISDAAPSNGQALVWNSSTISWEPATVFAGSSAGIQRNVAYYLTQSLNPTSIENGFISLGRGFILIKIETSSPAWVRLYSKIFYRTSDAGRTLNQNAFGGSGIISEVITSSSQLVIDLAPMAIGANLETPPQANTPIAIANLDNTKTQINATFTFISIEP